MLIEISQLPQTIQQQILMVKQGKTVQFTNQGEIFGELKQKDAPIKLLGDDKAFGILKDYKIDGLEYERQIRSEWAQP